MRRVLALGVYPVRLPIHGGQRRIHAISEFYRSRGIAYHYACIYRREHYRRSDVGSDDRPFSPTGNQLRVPLIDDMNAGAFAKAQAYDHFVTLSRSNAFDCVQLEQPFMWPLVRQLLSDGHLHRDIDIIYSSQNWEAPLKQQILVGAGVSPELARTVASQIEATELDLVRAATLVIAVSGSDAEIYARVGARRVVVVPNGVNRPIKGIASAPQMAAPYLFFVGSAHPPNIEGFCRLLLDGGAYYTPPRQMFAVCGGVCDGIANDTRFRTWEPAHRARLKFFKVISDLSLQKLRDGAHGVVLPITFGGGSNLKTAEALVSGKWVIGTDIALRGFEDFRNSKGVRIASTPTTFRAAIADVISRPALDLSKADLLQREKLHWDACFESSELDSFLFGRQHHDTGV